MADWQGIETAPRDGTPFEGLCWGRDCMGDLAIVWWQPEFDSFISGCRQITMAAGYTINGQRSELHSPEILPITHWRPWTPPRPQKD